MRGSAHFLDIAVAAYSSAPDTRSWLASVCEAAAPALDAGLGVMAWTFRPPHFVPENVVGVRGGEALADVCLRTTKEMAARSALTLGRAYTAPRAIETASEIASRSLGVDLDELPGFVEHAHPAGLRDFLGVRATCPSGVGLILGAPLPVRRRSTMSQRTAWIRPSAHLLAGLRLRVEGKPRSLDEADAVLAPGGKVVDARDTAVREREALRRAAVAFEHARTQAARRDVDEALRLFRALVSGEWSLVDAFDTDGRRFLVAQKNAPKVPNIGALSAVETQVACYVALGHPLKHVAYELGLPLSTIARHASNAVKKLGLRAPTELAALLAPFASALPEK
jgi:DNA-binding CsgD family transcriptional regulator